MVDYVYGDLFLKRSVDKQIKISADDGSFTVTNSDISWNGMELEESLCSAEEIQFGLCEPSMIKFRIINAFLPLVGKWMTVTETLGGKTDIPFQYGQYKVFSDKPTADREYRDITAYDAMYDIISADVTEWYNEILPDENEETWVTMRSFRTSFLRHFGIEQEEKELANDYMKVNRTIVPEQISGKDVIEAICEINGCFGHIGRDGKFRYIYLEQGIQGLYPRDDLFPADDLYPRDPKGFRIGEVAYIKSEYEDYEVKTIDKLQIRQQESDIGCIYGSGDNCYVIEDNFLVYGKGAEELNEIAQRIYKKITRIVYRPFSADCVGNPCLEVGDPIRILTAKKIVETYILGRSLKSSQVLRDRYEAKGTETRSQKVNSLQKSVIRVKQKTNELFRTVEETRLEMKDMESGMSSEIKATADEIRLDVSQNYETKNDAQSNYSTLSSGISLNADNISLKVSKGDVSSQISAEAGAVAIRSNRLTIEADNFRLTGGGAVSAKGEIETVQENGVSAKLKGNGFALHDLSGIEIGRYTATYDASNPSDRSKHGISIVTDAGDVGIGVHAGTKANIYYFMNNGRNPNGLTERHLFNQESRFINTVKAPSLLFANTSASYAKLSGGIYDGKSSVSCDGGFYAYGSIGCSGTKHRIVDTKNYGTVGMNAFETAGAYFSDIGSGKIELDKCYVYFDPAFLEVIDRNEEYQVLITRTSMKKTEWVEKHEDYFIAHGEPGASFDWMVIAKQKGYQAERMSSAVIESDTEIPYDESIFYGDDTPQSVSERYMYELEDTIDEDAIRYLKDFLDMENQIIEGVN